MSTACSGELPVGLLSCYVVKAPRFAAHVWLRRCLSDTESIAPAPYSGPEKVLDLGEFGLIDRLLAAVCATRPEPPSTGSGQSLIVGIGDDAGAWRQGDSVVVATTDSLVEGVHFPTGRASAR